MRGWSRIEFCNKKMKVWIFALFLQNPFPEGNTLFKFYFASWNWKQISCKSYSLKGTAFKSKSKSKLDLWMLFGGPNLKTRPECLLPIPPVGPGPPAGPHCLFQRPSWPEVALRLINTLGTAHPSWEHSRSPELLYSSRSPGKRGPSRLRSLKQGLGALRQGHGNRR